MGYARTDVNLTWGVTPRTEDGRVSTRPDRNRTAAAEGSRAEIGEGAECTRNDRNRHRQMMALTDIVVSRLEELNLADLGQSQPDVGTDALITNVLRAMPEEARVSFPGYGTVQQALDGFFEVQRILLDQCAARLRPNRTPRPEGSRDYLVMSRRWA
jgi:hypothetical protein